jgi:hypothetical protein
MMYNHILLIQCVRMKGIQNNNFISRKLVMHVSGLCYREGRHWNFFFSSAAYARAPGDVLRRAQ